MGSSVDGLVSGLNTTQIIQQLMAVERLPEQQLTQGKSDASNRASVLQSLNSLVSALQTAATAFAPDSVLTTSAWKGTVATSSNTSLATALGSSTAVPGSATFTVNQVATAASVVFAGSATSASTPVTNGPILLSKGAAAVGFSGLDFDTTSGAQLAAGTHTLVVTNQADGYHVALDGHDNLLGASPSGQTILTGTNGDTLSANIAGLQVGTATVTSVSGSMADIAGAINASSSTSGLQATVIGASASSFRLQVTSTTTGSASAITLNASASSAAPALGSLQQLSAGTDTVLHLGPAGSGFDVTSSTNAVSTLLPGVTITALKADPATAVTVSVASDAGGMADKMQALVDAANSALSFIGRNSAYDSNTKTAQPLLGNSMVSDLAQRITDGVIGSSSSTPALNGVSVQKDGTIAFDRQKFLDAYAKDPTGVQTTMTSMAQSLRDQAKQASDPFDGYLTAQITSEQASVKDYTDQIAAFEDRMTLRQQTLQTQYAALETALGQLQSQSQWLAGQLGSLTTPSTSSK